MARRRTYLLSLAAATTVAGCSDASNGSSDSSEDSDGTADGEETDAGTTTTAEPTATPAEDLSAAENGGYTVAVSASSDGSVTVDGTEITFTAPVEMTWTLTGFIDGDPVGRGSTGTPMGSQTPTDTPEGPALEIGPRIDPSDDAMHAFATPIYDADADRFEFRFYVDETYLDAFDEHYLNWGENSVPDPETREAEFTARAEGVYRATVTYDEPVSQDMTFPTGILLDRPFSEITPVSESRPEFTGIGVTPNVYPGPRVPLVAFEFDYDEDAETVTITHTAGDTVSADSLTVLLGGDPVEASFSGEVMAGDSTTVDVSGADSGTRMRVVWESDDGSASATLAAFTLP